jgi:hypothetical protein
MASEWSDFAYYNIGDKVVYFAGGLAGQQIFTALVANTSEVPYPPNASWSAGTTIPPSPATRVAYADFIDYPSDGETESGGKTFATTGAGRRTAPPSADWVASTASINGGIAKWSNFVYYNVNDRVFNTSSAGYGQASFQCVLANIGQSTSNPTYWTALP